MFNKNKNDIFLKNLKHKLNLTISNNNIKDLYHSFTTTLKLYKIVVF
jgi:hypothetical protein